MWNWFSKLVNKKTQPQRKRVDVEIPFEQHSYRKEDFEVEQSRAELEEDKSSTPF
ncbi:MULTISPECIES: hypothetical protein [Shewanella]|uniref:hypothetical protein n=1 Tax=Shewanella TaxID=22 RepID=UPI0004B5D082|nr:MULTISPECIES: hypothetical protein [Shewanella]